MNKQIEKNKQIARRRSRIRSGNMGTKDKPRLSVFKSNTMFFDFHHL